MIRALPVPAYAGPSLIPIGPAVPPFEWVLPAAAFVLLCVWNRSSAASMTRQLSPDVLPI
ncbi:hypothetical protein QO001_001686 [Methylobacterium brachiatum]|jgi:hypothetical protein|uniref:Uncharacterized protein n=1 Tax=Methylobacterium brachiatum TaxID=269660 RepID=A0AAJ1TRG0_9HYPH|nr:hypothetical protein [Methylobacterium brachiatum]GAN52295.1 hypothetical protein ME121_6424 [Methylobacterium sp. ME121]SFV15101.1 hypothetical protein SAMN02799643_06237 [Methylobacterium sp. UNCCL125]